MLVENLSLTLRAQEAMTGCSLPERLTTFETLRSVILADDRADSLTAEGTGETSGITPVDDLDSFHEPRMLEQVDQGAIERQGWQIPLSQLADGDLVYEAGVRVLLR